MELYHCLTTFEDKRINRMEVGEETHRIYQQLAAMGLHRLVKAVDFHKLVVVVVMKLVEEG